MEPVAMDTPHMDPFAPWLGADDLELLQTFHTSPATPPHTPRGSRATAATSTHGNSHPSRSTPFQFYSPHSSSSVSGDEQSYFAQHQHHYSQHRQHVAPFSHSTTSDAYDVSPIHTGSFTALMTTPAPPRSQPTRRTSRSSSSRASSSKSIASSRSSTSTSSPPASPLDTTLDLPILDKASLTPEELRREKNRQKVRRHYYRKLQHLNALRSEVEQLEGQFQSLLKQNETSRAVITTTPHAQQHHDRLMEELARSRSALEIENDELRRLFSTRQNQSMQLHELLTVDQALFMTTPLSKARFIKPLSLEECYAVRDKAVADVLMLTSRPRWSSHNHRGGGAMGIAGWQDDVSVENGFWKFSLQKTFRNLSPASISDCTWPMLTDPNVFSRLYSPAVEAKCVIVQRVDDRNLVLFQECRAMDANNEYVLMKSLFLASRVETATGELTVIRGLGEDRLTDRELFLPSSGEHAGRVVWHDLLSWTKYDRAGLYGDDCAVQFGGTAPTVGNNMAFWSVEIINLVVRWEYAIYGPPLLLTSSDDTNANANAKANASDSSSKLSSGRLEQAEPPTPRTRVRTPPMEVP